MFCGSDDHASAAANLFSLIASCKLHGIEPEGYLSELIRVLPYWPRVRYLELAPRYRLDTRARLEPSGETQLHPSMHPGPSGQWSVLRFVAPVPGRYQINWGLWGNFATTDARVDWIHSGSVASAVVTIRPAMPGVGSANNRQLTAGAFVDFGLNDGGNGSFNDTTIADLRIEYLGP